MTRLRLSVQAWYRESGEEFQTVLENLSIINAQLRQDNASLVDALAEKHAIILSLTASHESLVTEGQEEEESWKSKSQTL